MDTEGEANKEQSSTEQEKVKIDLQGAGLSLSREIDIETALEVANVVLGGTTQSGRSGSNAKKRQRGSSTGVSVAEAITASEASTNAERIVAIGAWLEDENDQESFTVNQVKEQFQKAKHKTPANMSRDWNQAVKAGWVAGSQDEDGQYYVTKNTGRPALQRRFAKKS